MARVNFVETRRSEIVSIRMGAGAPIQMGGSTHFGWLFSRGRR